MARNVAEVAVVDTIGAKIGQLIDELARTPAANNVEETHGELSNMLTASVDSHVAAERGSRADIVAEMAEAADITPGTVNQILAGEISCPPRNRLAAFARVLGLSVEDLVQAAGRDGCTYAAVPTAEVNRTQSKVEQATVGLKVERHGEAGPGEFAGYASVFGVVVDGIMPTIIERGAFTASLARLASGGRRSSADGQVPILWQHDIERPIGKSMQVREDDNGLYVRGQISETSLGRDVRVLLNDGVVHRMSIGFAPVTWHMQDDGDGEVRHITDLDLWEISLVTFAADENALISEVASSARRATESRGQLSTEKLAQLANIRERLSGLVNGESVTEAPPIRVSDDTAQMLAVLREIGG